MGDSVREFLIRGSKNLTFGRDAVRE